jgi:hypothetical protein
MLVSIDIVFYGPQIQSYVYYDCRGATVGDRGPWRGCMLIQLSLMLSINKPYMYSNIVITNFKLTSIGVAGLSQGI